MNSPRRSPNLPDLVARCRRLVAGLGAGLGGGLPSWLGWWGIAAGVVLAPVELSPSGVGLAQERVLAVRLADDWPQFRGPDGLGVFPAAALSRDWSETQGLEWKVKVPGTGWSSPVIVDGLVWLTAATNSGKDLRVLAFDTERGRLVKNVKVFELDRAPAIHGKNSHASPTPIVSEGRVYVHFGAQGTACLDTGGQIVWKRVLPYYQHHGNGGSPVLCGQTLVVVCDGFTGPFYDKQVKPGIDAPQFVVGLSAETGETRWRQARDGRHSYCTPLAVEVDGSPQVICPGGDSVWAYHPETGESVWRCRYEGYSVIPRPVVAGGLVFVCTGYDAASLLAIRLGGRGDVTHTHVAWKHSQGVPFTPSPVIVDRWLCMVSDNGILSCLDWQTGKLVWKERLGGNYSASPLAVGDLLYCVSEEGVTHVVRVGERCERLTTPKIKGKTYASLGVSAGRLFLRSDKQLYCLESAEPGDRAKEPAADGAVEPTTRADEPAARETRTAESR